VHLLDLVKKTPRLGCRLDAPHYALEEFEAEPILGVGKKPADSRLRHSEEPRGPADRSGHHDGPERFDLAEIETH